MNDAEPTPSPTISNARPPDAGISLGLGLTNECNLACAFCYRDPTRADRLSLEQVKSVIESLPVRSVNLGTGENGMHPDYKAILTYLRAQPLKLTITSNGHSVAVLEDHDLRNFHDIEFSLDYPTQAEQDAQRGPGNWELIRATSRALCAFGCTGNDYRGHDEIKLFAAGGCRSSCKTAWRSLACERISSSTVRSLCAYIRRILARIQQAVREHRCNRHRRAFGAGDGRAAATRRRVRSEHGEDYAPRDNAALRLLARPRRAIV